MEKYLMKILKEVWKTAPNNLKRFRVANGRLAVTDEKRLLDIAVPGILDGVYGEDFLSLAAGASFPKIEKIVASALAGTDCHEHEEIPAFSARPQIAFIGFRADNSLRFGKYLSTPKPQPDIVASVDASFLSPLALLPGMQNKFQHRKRQYSPLVWTSELEGPDGAPLWHYILMPLQA